MAHFSLLHLADASARGGFRELPALAPHEYNWPDGTSPEAADWLGVDAPVSPRAALDLALYGEHRGHAYYATVAAASGDAELRATASQFADEEAEHVHELEKLLSRCTA